MTRTLLAAKPSRTAGLSPAPSACPAAFPSVSAIEAMDRPALLALWGEVFGSGKVPPRSMSQPFLRRVLAWEVQARAQGGLPAALRRRLDALGDAQTREGTKGGPAGAAGSRASSPRLKPGGRLLREWAGVTHVVDMVEGGFLWQGGRHRSLSAIAQAITGAHWSGPRFFGLKEAKAEARVAAKTQAKSKAKVASRRPRGLALLPVPPLAPMPALPTRRRRPA